MTSPSEHHAPELNSSSSKDVTGRELLSSRANVWPVLATVAAFLREHPSRDRRPDVKRLADVVRNAELAVKRGVGVSAEVWVACCLEHAEVRAEHRADGWGALLWALTRAKGVAELQRRVAPELHAIVARAGSAAAPAGDEKQRQREFEEAERARRREKLRQELEEKKKRG